MSADSVSIKTDRIYVKEISCKVPQAPQFFINPEVNTNWEPQFSFEMHMKHQALSEVQHEVTIYATIAAKNKQNVTALSMEVQQSGIFTLTGFEKDQLMQALGNVCMTSLYPYLCRTVADASVQAGFPPVLLSPLNFELKAAEVDQLKDQSGDSLQDRLSTIKNGYTGAN
jgi:preprotein translocase subunit SecB